MTTVSGVAHKTARGRWCAVRMRHMWSDAAADAHDSELADAALAEAQSAAAAIAESFTSEWARSSLRPDASVNLDVGGDDQTLFTFSLNVDLDDDLDANEYPMDALQELASALRARVTASPVNGWAWLVENGTKASAVR